MTHVTNPEFNFGNVKNKFVQDIILNNALQVDAELKKDPYFQRLFLDVANAIEAVWRYRVAHSMNESGISLDEIKNLDLTFETQLRFDANTKQE